MYHLTPFTLVSLAISVTALISRTAPSTWSSELEPHTVYHSRYMALNCPSQRGTNFYNECCHPLKAHQPLDSRPPDCNPDSNDHLEDLEMHCPVTTSSAASSTAFSDPSLTPLSDHKVYTGGVATYFFQNDNAGACGTVHNDTDFVGALTTALYGNGAHCKSHIKITNTKSNQTVTVEIADECPTCDSENCIDLSKSAFLEICTVEKGECPISWYYVP